METFESLREYRVVRLTENKDRFIQKNTLLTAEQKQEVLEFFHSHANLEARVNNGNWNFDIPYEEFKRVMDSVDTQAKRLKKQSRELRKQNGLEGLKEGEDYSILTDTPKYTAYKPLTHKGMRVIASNMVEPKLWCESAIMEWSPKEILPKGEPMKGNLYPGAKWCVAMETDGHWKSYTSKGYTFIVVCSKDPNMEEDLKKICLAYKSRELSREDSVPASDTGLGSVQSNYVETVIGDLEKVWSEHILEDIQRCYHPESGVYQLSNRVISSKEFLKLDKLDHPVIWEGDFGVPRSVTSLEGCPEKVTGAFRCESCVNLKSLKGAPTQVGGNFDCPECDSLTTLEGAPEYVGGDFDCSWCSDLVSLKGAPRRVGESFWCPDCNNLTSLKGAPEYVEKNFYCSRCKSLTSLKGAPKFVGGDFTCDDCSNLTSFEGALEHVGGNLYCNKCPNLKSAEGASKRI